MKRIGNAVSYIIYNKDRSMILSVKRPSNDRNLPNVWGLPAGTVKKGENSEDAVLRSGIEKLGVKLKIIKELNEGNIERKDHILHMKLYEVEIIEGEPKVKQPYPKVTQYQKWRWEKPDSLKKAAAKGSLCSRLYLESLNIEW